MKTFQERSKSAVAVAREYFQSPTAVKLKDFLELFNDEWQPCLTILQLCL